MIVMLISSDASKPTRNGFVHPRKRTQKPTEGPDVKSPTTLGETKWHKSHTEGFSTILKLVYNNSNSNSLNKNNLFTEVLKLKEANDVGNCRNSRGERSISSINLR